jgi:hypothetical protein
VIAIFSLMVQFLALRFKNSSLPEENRDPHLGRKFGLHVFQHVGMLLILVGLTLSAVDIADQVFGNKAPTNSGPTMYWGPGSPPPPASTPPPNPFTEVQQAAAGLMLSGVLHTILFTMLILFGTNAMKQPAVGRAFHMNRTMIAGLILLTVTTMFCMVLFKDTTKNSIGLEMFSKIIGVAVIWGPTALGHFLWVMVDMAKDKQRTKAKRDREE